MVTIGVTSVGSGIGQAVLRALAASDLDHRVIGLDAGADNSGIHWVDSAHLLPLVRDLAAYRERLLDVVAAEGIDALIPGLDLELPVLADLRDELRDLGCTVVVSDRRVVELSVDKLATAEWSRARGLPFVRTRTLPDAQAEADQLDYPVIIKPRTGSSSAQIRLAGDPDALRREVGDDQMIVQPYLPPRDRDLVALDSAARIDQLHEISAQYIVGSSGRILGSFVSMNRLRNGIPVKIEPVDDAPWADDGRAFAEALAADGARGPVNLQGRLDAHGRVQFFEINTRFTGITGVRTQMGFREVEATVRDLVLDDEEGAVRSLRTDHGLVGLRHVGDMVVAADRISSLEQRSAPRREPAGRVVVSGASSYVGRATIAALLAHDVDEVHALVRTPASGAELAGDVADARLHLHQVDLLDRTIELPPADAVIHLAAVRAAGDAPPHLHEVNVEGTRRLLCAARDAGATRFAYLSSQSIYGVARPPLWGESLPPRPTTPYATSKWLGEEMCREQVVEGLQLLVLRAARVYGLASGMRWDELPHAFARRTARGGGLTIHGDGHQRMDLVHVRDVADALVRSVTAELPGAGRMVINLGGGHPVSIRELAAAYEEAAKELDLEPPHVEHVDAAGDPVSFGMHIRRARAILGWSPATPLRDAVRELVVAAR